MTNRTKESKIQTNTGLGRKQFIQTFGFALASTAFSTMEVRAKQPPPLPLSGNPDDEEYWTVIRSQFPLSDKISYMNNGTMGPSPFPVAEAFKKAIDRTNMDANYGGGDIESVEALAGLVNAHRDEIAITHNVTEGINIVCWGLKLKKGDEILITGHEHVGNGLPWLLRSKLHKLKLKIVPLGSTAEETLNNFKKAFSKKTKVLAVPHIPCTIGQILPVKEICAEAKKRGVFAFIDGAHGPGMLKLDLHDMGCDAYASCCHKWLLAPTGTGFLYVKKEKLDAVQAYSVGGYSSLNWDLLHKPPILEGLVPTAHRYYYGTQSAALYYAIVAAVEFNKQIGVEVVEKRIRRLAASLQEKLLGLGSDKIEMLTPTEAISRGSVIAFRLKKTNYNEFANYCREKHIIIRSVPENGINCVRVSTHIYNSHEEIDRLVELVKEKI